MEKEEEKFEFLFMDKMNLKSHEESKETNRKTGAKKKKKKKAANSSKDH